MLLKERPVGLRVRGQIVAAKRAAKPRLKFSKWYCPEGEYHPTRVCNDNTRQNAILVMLMVISICAMRDLQLSVVVSKELGDLDSGDGTERPCSLIATE